MSANPRFGRVATGLAQKLVDAFAQATPGVVSAVLLSADGFEVAAVQVGKGGASRLAAMGSSLTAIGSAIAQEAGIVACRRMVIEAESGTVVIINIPEAKPPMSLAIIADQKAVLGQLMWAAKSCGEAVARAFKD